MVELEVAVVVELVSLVVWVVGLVWVDEVVDDGVELAWPVPMTMVYATAADTITRTTTNTAATARPAPALPEGVELKPRAHLTPPLYLTRWKGFPNMKGGYRLGLGSSSEGMHRHTCSKRIRCLPSFLVSR